MVKIALIYGGGTRGVERSGPLLFLNGGPWYKGPPDISLHFYYFTSFYRWCHALNHPRST